MPPLFILCVVSQSTDEVSCFIGGNFNPNCVLVNMNLFIILNKIILNTSVLNTYLR